MNKIYGFLLIAVLMVAGGCKQDPAVVPAYLQNVKLLGKWYLKDLEITNEDGTSAGSLTTFSDKDFFDFRTGNAATYSSTIRTKSYEGYYAANSLNNPTTLSFKSGNLYLMYNIDYIDTTELQINEVKTKIIAGVTINQLYQYTYSRTL